MHLFNTGDLMELSKNSNKKKFNGFTMAEVLITLGILGVVIAMTLPSLIGKWQKTETLTRLKRAYTVLSQAINYSIAEYGDVSGWDIYSNHNPALTESNVEKTIKNFSSTYVVPYLPKVKKAEYTTFRNAGYTKEFTNIDGSLTTGAGLDDYRMFIMLNDGTYIFIRSGDHENKITNILFWVDVNGLKKPNVMGRDLFLMMLRTDKYSPGKLEFYNHAIYKYEDFLRKCQEGADESRMCGMLIMMDGWQIKKHYPWR